MNDDQEFWAESSPIRPGDLEDTSSSCADPCQQLHYLQMASEKLGKAYFRRPSHSPSKSHATFVPFLRAIGSLPKARRGLIADLFQFQSYLGFQVWINAALPLAYDLERLAPALAQDETQPGISLAPGRTDRLPDFFRVPDLATTHQNLAGPDSFSRPCKSWSPSFPVMLEQEIFPTPSRTTADPA